MGREFLGEFEHVVLLALARCGEEAYAVPIHEQIEERTRRPVSIPAVYVTLSRLEKKGLVSSRMGDPSPRPGGRARRYFELRPAGIKALRESRQYLASLWDGLELEAGQGTPQ